MKKGGNEDENCEYLTSPFVVDKKLMDYGFFSYIYRGTMRYSFQQQYEFVRIYFIYVSYTCLFCKILLWIF